MNTLNSVSLILICSSVMVVPAQATDTVKEERWANQTTEFLLDGGPEWLEADGRKFLSIYTPATTDKVTGAVILLHGRGVHPDWPQVIQPLRTQLPDKGWATLSLQMPVLANDATDENYVPLFNEVPARIEAGLKFLSQKNINNIVLMGHSLGASMGSDYLARHHESRIKAFVGIGMKAKPLPAKYRSLDNVESLKRMDLPILDVYGSQTIKSILDYVDRRAAVVDHTNFSQSRQLKIEGAGHFYQGHEKKLVEDVSAWLDETLRESK